MARAPLTFRQRDVIAAIRAVKGAGETVYRVEIDKSGRIIVVTRPEDAPPSKLVEVDEWEGVEEAFDRPRTRSAGSSPGENTRASRTRKTRQLPLAGLRPEKGMTDDELVAPAVPSRPPPGRSD
jgi:hypothetical protein